MLARFQKVRKQTLKLVEPLEIEDFVVQPIEDVSPPKWHLAHTTWFFEVFVLVPNVKGYQLFNKDYPYLFNSYYVAAGDRWTRAQRGHLTRPTVKEVMQYRKHVEEHLSVFLGKTEINNELKYVLEIGLQHEQQHQELLLYDVKFILGHNPLFPVYKDSDFPVKGVQREAQWLSVEKGNYHIGHTGDGFCFDNELGRHEVHLEAFDVSDQLVTNGEFLEFMKSGGYENHTYWLSEGWEWAKSQLIKAPMYWINENGEWLHYTFGGLKSINPVMPVSHLSYFEADAFARWKGCRLPTEFEWEVAAFHYGLPVSAEANFMESNTFQPIPTVGQDFFGNLWEWTSSAYLPYPFYKAPDGALGEYNGKFMVNQKVLRGGSFGTSRDQIRLTYRNFFHPHLQWLFSGVRLARHI
ncbi:MAG: ergothioneine biosynthesis protein EgtB [Marinoscillum sp.]